jgi:hypothetical protein
LSTDLKSSVVYDKHNKMSMVELNNGDVVFGTKEGDLRSGGD